MSFFIISEGSHQIDHIFGGETEEDVINNAREMINRWPEYAELDDDELLGLLEQGSLEFDLVRIDAPWPGDNLSKSELIRFYKSETE